MSNVWNMITGGSIREFVRIPAASGSLTYTGAAQSPAWTGYDTSKMTLGGTTSGTNAGSYTAVFALKDPARTQWADGTAADKQVAWTIGKAPGSLTIAPTSIHFNAMYDRYDIVVTRAGDGAITAVCDKKSVTLRVEGETIKANGSTRCGPGTITVSVAEGTNHTAPQSAACSVTSA